MTRWQMEATCRTTTLGKVSTVWIITGMKNVFKTNCTVFKWGQRKKGNILDQYIKVLEKNQNPPHSVDHKHMGSLT